MAAQDEVGQTSGNPQDSTFPSPTSAADAGTSNSDNVDTSDVPPESPSFLLTNVAVSEGGQAQPSATTGNSTDFYSEARISGNANLLKFWRRSVTALDYVGSGLFGSSYSQQIQQLIVGQRFLWTKRQLTLTDSLGTFPGGTFGASAFGGSGLYDLIFAGTGVSAPTTPDLYLLSGVSSFGGIGQGTHLTNVSQAQLTQVLTPRSSVTVAGAYGFTDYGNTGNLVNSRQVALLADYNYQLSARSNVGILYGYQDFRFPETSEGKLKANQFLFLFQRQVSSRFTFAVGAGPEFADLRQTQELKFLKPPLFITLKTNQVNLTAYGLAQYKLKQNAFVLSYHRLVSNGSGLSTGSNSDIVEGSISRGIGRAWRGNIDGGYVRLKQITGSSAGSVPGSFQYWYAGAAVQRPVGGHFSVFASYESNVEHFGGSFCSGGSICNGLWNIFSVGLSWYGSPIRLGRSSEQNSQEDATGGATIDPSMIDDSLSQTPLQWRR